MSKLLEIKDLTVQFKGQSGYQTAVKGIDLTIHRGQIFGLVGESGSGKSVTALSILNLLPKNAEISQGSIFFQGEDLLKKSETQMNQIRGNKISMIFQDPMTSLNPVFKVGRQIQDVIRRHQELKGRQAFAKVVDLLDQVGIQDPEQSFHAYPHEFSGGMRQRAMIAMAIACDPDLIIADEPTTALDVSTQSEILQLIQGLNKELGMTILLITHDLGVVANMCTWLAVMQAGRIVENKDVYSLFQDPQDPYTRKLLASLPINLNRQRLEEEERHG